MSHPHQPLIYARKQVCSNKKIDWGDPSRLERIHRTLRQRYVSTVPSQSMTKYFHLLDKDYPNSLSVRGFNALLVNSGVNLSSEDAEHLFAFYDAEGHGSLDMNDFLIGLRYNLAMDKIETNRIRRKLQTSLVRGRSAQELERLLICGGLPSEGITETAFVKACKGLIGSTCTTSELLFLFSVMSGNDRNAVLSLDTITRMLFGSCTPQEGCRDIDIGELIQRLGRVIYDPSSTVSGRIGLSRILSRGDKDGDGALNRREFESMKSFTPFDNAEIDALFNHLDTSGKGLVYVCDLVSNYRPQQYLGLTESEIAAIENIAIRHIRNRSPGGAGFQRTYERYLEQTFQKHDPQATGFFTLTQFYHVMDDLAGMDMKDVEVEILFERWAKGGRVDWREFLSILVGDPCCMKAACEQAVKSKQLDPQSLAELRERIALALEDRDRQTSGPRGFLRIERLFNKQDICGTGQVNEEEFRRAMRSLPGLPCDEGDLGALFRSFDHDGSGLISFAEFINAMQGILNDRCVAKKSREHIPYPYEDISVLKAAVSRGAMRRRLGKHGLMMTFGKHDTDGDGLLDLRSFLAVMHYVSDPVSSEENLTHLFNHYDPERSGKVSYKAFVDSLDLAETYSANPAEIRDIFNQMATLFRGWGQSSTGTTTGMKELFTKYARTTPCHLTMPEFLKAMRSLGYHGPALDAELAFRYMARGGQGLSFDQFSHILKGTAMQNHPAGADNLLQRLHHETYGDNKFGTMSFARLLNKRDNSKSSCGGLVDLKAFRHVMKAVGSSMNDDEIKALFKSFNPEGGNIVIRDFLERLRTSVVECSDEAKIRSILNILGTNVEFRNQGMGGWTSRFELYDHNRDGKVDFYGFSKAVDFIDCNKLSDYEKERLFNHYSTDNVTLDYHKLVCDVLYRPLNRGRDHHVDPFGLDPKYHVLEPQLMADEAVLRPPPDVLADQSIFRRLAAALYAPERDAMGTLKLTTYLKTCSHSAKYLKKRDFINTIMGLIKAPGTMPEYEVVALYEQLKEGDRGVDMEAFACGLRNSHGVTLNEGQLQEIINRIQEQMWNCGKRNIAGTREIFRSQVRDDGFIDLSNFVQAMRRAGGGLYTDLELELLFNHFSADRRVMEIDPFAAAIVPPTRLAPPTCPGPTPSDIRSIADRLGAHVYDSTRISGGTLEFLKGIRHADRDRDDLLNRQEFMEALQYCGASLVLSANDMAALFDSIARGSGVLAQVSVHDLEQLVRGSAAHPRPGLCHYQELLASIKPYFPYSNNDPAAIRIFERQDPHRTGRVCLGKFTTAVLQLFHHDFPLRDLQIEQIFDVLDRDRTGTVNYREFLDALASLPSRSQTGAKEEPPRVVDAYRRTDVQPNMVRSPISLRPPTPIEVPSDVTPFRVTNRVLPLDQPGMHNWHVTAGSRDLPYAGGAASVEEREARHPRYRGLWIPGGPVHRERQAATTQCIPMDRPGSPRSLFIPGMAESLSDANASLCSVLPPYLIEASSLDEWISLLGLEKYLPALRANEIDLATITELNEADLQDMGLPIGPRRKILKAARLMR